MPLTSSQVPQADSLQRIIEFIERIAAGLDPARDELGGSSRHDSNYMRAAEALGLVSLDGELLEAGRAVLALPKAARWARLVLSFEASPCGKAWCLHQGVEDLRGVDPSSAFEFLSDASDLSPSSCRRRSQTLRRWLIDLHPHHPLGPPTFTPSRPVIQGVEESQTDLFNNEVSPDEDESPTPPGVGAKGESPHPATEAEQDVSRRLRTLLRTAPIHRLEGSKSQRSIPLERYDLRSVSLRIFDTVISYMGMGSGLTRADLLRELRPALVQMDPKAPPARHTEVFNLVLDGLLNERERRQAFSEAWTSIEEGVAVKRLLSFHLLREEEAPDGDIVLRATHEGINVYAGMLDTDVEDAQAAEEAILRSQLRRGRLQQAQGTARRALQRSIEYEQKLSLLLDTARRDVTQVDWVHEALKLLAEAREHIRERLEVERELVSDIERRLDALAGQPEALQLAKLRDTLNLCFDRHIKLQGRVARSNEVWLGEQERQRFRPKVLTPLPDPEADILRPALALPMGLFCEAFDGILRWHNAPHPPHLLYLPHLLSRLLAPRRRRHEEREAPGEPELDEQELGETLFPPADREAVAALLDEVDGIELSSLLSTARERGFGPLALRLTVLTALRAFDDREEQTSLRVVSAGAPLDDPDFSGDDLHIWHQEGPAS